MQGGVIWDDDDFVTENWTLREPGGLGRIWFQPEASPHYYPLLLTTWWVEYRLTGLDLTVSHGVNVLLHALCVLVLWRVVCGGAVRRAPRDGRVGRVAHRAQEHAFDGVVSAVDADIPAVRR